MPKQTGMRSSHMKSPKLNAAGAQTEAQAQFMENQPTVTTSDATQPLFPDLQMESPAPSTDYGQNSDPNAAPDSSGLSPDFKQAFDAEAANVQKYDSPTKAAAIGIAQGLLPGANYFLKKMGLSNEEIKGYQENSPFVHGAGEIAGFGAGILTGTAEEKAAQSAVEGVAGVAGKLTLGGLTETASKALGPIVEQAFKNKAEKTLLRQVVEKGLVKGISEVPSGAALGINDLLNENAVGDAELNGQNLLAHAGAGAVLMGVAGGAFGALEATAPVVSTAFDKATGQMKKILDQELDPIKAITKHVVDNPSDQIYVEKTLRSVSEDDLKKTLSDRVQFSLNDSHATLATKLEGAKTAIGNDISKVYENVDAANPAGTVPAVELHQQLKQELRDFVSENKDYFDNKSAKNIYNKIDHEIDARAARIKGVDGAQNTWDLVKYFGDKGKAAFGADADATLQARMYARLNGAARDILQQNIEAQTVNTPLQGIITELKSLNGQFRTAATLSSAISTKAAKGADFDGLKSALYIASGAAFNHPIAATAGMLGRKFLASDLRRKAVILNYLQRSNTEGAAKIAEGVSGFLNKGKAATNLLIKASTKDSVMNSGFALADNKQPPKDMHQAFQNVSKNITHLVVDPDVLSYKIANNTMKAGYAAPNSIKMAQVTLGKAVQFLYEKMPKSPTAGLDVTGVDKWQPSSMEMAQFSRYLHTVENPYSALHDLKTGTITNEQVETLQQVYPAIYNQIKSKMLDEIKNKPVPYNTKVKMGILFDSATAPSLDPQAVLNLQQNFEPTAMQSSQPAGGIIKSTVGGMKELGKSDRIKTPMQEAAEGLDG